MVVVPRGDGGEPPARPVILLIDQRPLFLAAMERLLGAAPQPFQLVCCTASDAGVEMALEHRADLVICELGARPFGALDVPGALAARGISAPVMLLGESADEIPVFEALSAGADGLLCKDTAASVFFERMDLVMRGHIVLDRRLISRFTSEPAAGGLAGPARSPLTQLSPTELRILSMLGEAKTVSAIAVERGVSRKTVRNHLASIYRKLELKSRAEAMLAAARWGLTPAS